MSLDESITQGQAGHILDHEVIHARLLGSRKLWNHRRALKAAADGTARCVIGYLGDSTTEGAGIDSIEDRALNVCQRILRERFTEADTGRGYIPAFYGSGVTPDEEPVLAGSTTERGTEGLGFRSLALNASGAMATWELHGTDMILCYASYAGAPGPKSEYRIDGGSWVEVDHLGGSGLDFREEQTAVSLGVEDDYTIDWRWKSDGAGAAPHPVIEGIIEINGDPDKGISVLDMGRSGQTASFFADNGGNELLPQWVSDHDMSLIVIGLGFNEWQTAVSPATYKTKLQSLITQLRAGNADLEIVLHGGQTPLGLGDPDDWYLYVEAMYEVAAADDLTSVFDIHRFMPDPGVVLTADHYDAFGLHPNATGGNAIGAADADHLSLRSGGAYSFDWIPTATQDELDLKLAKASNLSDLANSQTARNNLGVARGSGVPPTGALAESAPRDMFTGAASGLNSGVLRVVGVWLPAGMTVTSITFVSNSQAAVSPTNWWFGLFDSSRVCLRFTADQTSTAWAANTAKTVNLTSAYATTYSGLHYLGIMMAAGTTVNMNVYTASATLNALAPTRAGNTSDSGLTSPPSLPFTAGTITSSANVIYAYVS